MPGLALSSRCGRADTNLIVYCNLVGIDPTFPLVMSLSGEPATLLLDPKLPVTLPLVRNAGLILLMLSVIRLVHNSWFPLLGPGVLPPFHTTHSQ